MNSAITYENDPRTSEEVVRDYRLAIESEDADVSLALVHFRGGRTEFDLGARYARSADSLDREVGADILAQLGWNDRRFPDESVAILLALLHDPAPRVISAAATALGHRQDPRAIPELLPLLRHPDPSVRLGVVNGLSWHDDAAAIRALAVLAGDEDRDVRNWAAFGLGQLTDLDLPELREALAKLLDDPDPEIRGEALIGLARRRDARVRAPLVRELEGPFYGSWCLEAAELLADPDLLKHLTDLKGRLPVEDAAFAADFDRAILACGGAGDGAPG